MDEDDIPAVDSGAGDNPILKVGEEQKIGNQGLMKKLLKEGEGSDTPDVDDEVHDDIPAVDSGAGDNPILNVGEEQKIGNQGLMKKLLKEGEGSDTPDVDDEVHGQVIKGWGEGIRTMRKGEKALFTIPPKLAYGKSGCPPHIPPNATLQYDVDLLSWTSSKDICDICKDGGLFKEILDEGEKWEYPKDLDEVLVKYEAHLDDGTLVAKSDGVEFTVKEGFFCLALSKAVKTMKKGENVVLTVKPQYGFGVEGKPAHGDEIAVPSNATLKINLELVSWKTVFEVTDDKKVIKKILKEGEGYKRPIDGAVVKLKIIGKLQDGTVFLKKGHGDDEAELFEFTTDEEQVVDGLEKAVMTMKKGEMALLTIAPEYAFGLSESQQELAVVPPNSTLYYEVELVSFIKITEEGKRSDFRTTLRDKVRDWSKTKLNSDENKKFYYSKTGEVKLAAPETKCFTFEIENYKWLFNVTRGGEQFDMDFGFTLSTTDKSQLSDIDSILVSRTTFHPSYSHLNHFEENVQHPLDGQGGRAGHVFTLVHENAYSDGFADDNNFVRYEIQVQAIRKQVYPPLLPLTVRMEMFGANREFVLARCYEYIMKTQNDFKQVINDNSRWPSLCTLLKDRSYIASQSLLENFSVAEKEINEKLVNTFYKLDRGWISALILDMVHLGYKLTCTKKRKSECVVTHEDGKFQMNGDVAALFVRSANLKYDDSGAARKADSRSLDLELEFQEKIGFVILQVFVTAHFFRLCVLFLDDYLDKKPSKKNKSKNRGKSKVNKGMQSQARVQLEEGEEAAVEDEQKKDKPANKGMQSQARVQTEKGKEIAVENEQKKHNPANTFNDLSELVSQRVSKALNKSFDAHRQLVSEFDEQIEVILGECGHTFDAFLLTQMRYEIYNQAARNICDLYENNFYEKHQHFDFNSDSWSNVGKSFEKKYQKTDEEAKNFGHIGERLARSYLSDKYNDKVRGHEIRWVNEITESRGPFDLALVKGNDILHYFEVKITDIPEKFHFSMTPSEIILASRCGDFYSVVFLKVKPDYSVDIFEIRNPLSKPSEVQAILRARKEGQGLQSVSMSAKEVNDILKPFKLHLSRGSEKV